MTVGRIPSVEGGIQPTLLTAKGDLISATAASTVARLPVGSDAQILVADSTASTGLKWATPSGGFTYAAFTPTWSGITIGNGTVIARYAQSGKFVTGYIKITLGSTSSVSSSPIFTLPVAENTDIALQMSGSCNLRDTGSASYLGGTLFFGDGTATIRCLGANIGYAYNTDIDGTTPFTWTTSDIILITFNYEAA
jgi:hypothetical protein